jgi:hypothetical protein
LSDFEEYLAKAEAGQTLVAISQVNLSTRHSVPVLSTRQQRDAYWESHLQSEKKRLQDAITSTESCSDDDNLPIVNTLPSTAAPKKKNKRAPKTLWTYEAVHESSSPASKYWDVKMSTERATKRRAKEKFMSSEDDAAPEKNTLQNAITSRESCSDDDDLPIVNTLSSSQAPLSKKKRAPKILWTYETVVESSSPASKYWDVDMSTERTTKRQAKENLVHAKLDSDNEPDNVEGCNGDDDVSEYNGSDVEDDALPTKKGRKRKQLEVAEAQKNLKRPKKVIASVHTIQSVLSTWSEETDYGVAFRGMGDKEQVAEVVRLNKSVAKGTKDAMKLKTLNVMYKTLCSEKLRDYLIEQRPPLTSMFRTAEPRCNPHLREPTYLSVGEWVEVDADRTPGWNSEGGIAVITCVHDSFADVKYVGHICLFENICHV